MGTRTTNMKFKDVLTEKWKNSVNVNGGTVEIFEDPSRKEIKDIMDHSYGTGSVRIGVTDSKNPKLYAWDPEFLHRHIRNAKGIKFDIGFTYWNNRGDTVDVMGMMTDDWEYDIDNKDAVVKKLKKFFPKIKVIEFTNDFIKV